MKAACKIGLLFLAFLLTESVSAALPVKPDSSAFNLFETERGTLLKRISFEKVRIANDFTDADKQFFILVDSVTYFVLQQPVPADKRNLYLTRLQVFLSNINRYYSDSYFKNGTYKALLSYFAKMIEWDENDDLTSNIKQYSAFTIRAARLIPNETVAEDFLTDYMNDKPDDIFRYTEEFEDRKFALRVLEKATRLAPESAKRYFTSGNAVSQLLKGSRDPYVLRAIDIYNDYGLRSRAYLLLDQIVKGTISLKAADSIGNHPAQMFSLQVGLCMRKDAPITYSTNRFIESYSIETLRKMNQDAVAAGDGFSFEQFKKCNPEEMFEMLCYGHREAGAKIFPVLFDLMNQKADGRIINGIMIANIDKDKLKEFVIYCDKYKLLEKLLALVDDNKKDYLLTLSAAQHKEASAPPAKTFNADEAVAKAVAENLSPKPIVQAKPPKPAAPDTIAVAAKQPAVKTKSASTNAIATYPGAAAVVEPAKKPAEITPVLKKPEPAVAVIEKPKPEPKAVPPAPAKDVVEKPIPVEVVTPIVITLDERTKTILTLKKNILQTIEHIPTFINKDYAEEVLMYAAQKEPDELFKKIGDFKAKYFCKKILEECAINAPVSLKRYLYNNHEPVNYILLYSQNPVVKKIFEINPSLGYRSKPLLLIDDIIEGKMTVSEAIEKSNDPNELFSAVVKIISKPKYIGRYSIDREMRDYSLHFIRDINDKIATGAPQPFSGVETFSSADLYFLMLYGRDEVFTSSFNGLFDRFIQRLPKDNGEAFLTAVNYNRFRDFVSLCASYGRLSEFLTKFSAEAKNKVLQLYVSKLETEKDNLSSIVLVAEAISNLTDNALLVVLQQSIKKEYERVTTTKDQIGISIYGVLSSIISGNAKTEVAWYRKVAQQFKISPSSMLPTSVLFCDSNVCAEQMYFYNDDDGRSSFINFMNSYRNQNAWAIEDHNSYVRIYSRQQKKVEILANKPASEENGVSAINDYLNTSHLEPLVIVHRGHSFHTEATLEHVPAKARLIFLGSCGGFYKISLALENAPDAHIISTKQIGTKTVNDLLLFALNESIRTGKDIDWNEFWDKMRDKLGNNPYFGDYVPPHKNLESTFIRAYYKTLGV